MSEAVVTPAVAPAPRPARRDRVIGLDLARFVALAGMMATHVWLYTDIQTQELVWFSGQFEGRASALFAVLAGAGAVLATRGLLREGRRGSARLMLLGRGLALVVIGLTLTLLDNVILVILVYYGVLFWFLAVVITWRRWILVALAAVLAVVAPLAARAVAVAQGLETYDVPNANWVSLVDDPLGVGRDLLLTGTYPALIWLVYGVVGVVVGRAVLAAASTGALRLLAVRLVAIGAAVWLAALAAAAVVQFPLGVVAQVAAEYEVTETEAAEALNGSGYGRPGAFDWDLLGAGPHTGSTFDVALTTGSSLVIIGLCLLLGSVLGRTARRILSPVTAAGGAPLTVYTAHVLLVGIVSLSLLPKPWMELSYPEFVALGTPWFISSLGFYLLNLALALGIGAILAAMRRRGPLETLVTFAGRSAARLVPPRPARLSPATAPATGSDSGAGPGAGAGAGQDPGAGPDAPTL